MQPTFFRSANAYVQVLDSLCSLGKVPNQNNEAGCEKKLRLFTLKGRRLENMEVSHHLLIYMPPFHSSLLFQVIGAASDVPTGSTVMLEYGEQLPSIDKKKVAVGKKISKDDCCVC